MPLGGGVILASLLSRPRELGHVRDLVLLQIAVIAVVPCTPARANAVRSAWIPAPPPESEPAIERQTGMRRGRDTAAKDRTASAGGRPRNTTTRQDAVVDIDTPA